MRRLIILLLLSIYPITLNAADISIEATAMAMQIVMAQQGYGCEVKAVDLDDNNVKDFVFIIKTIEGKKEPAELLAVVTSMVGEASSKYSWKSDGVFLKLEDLVMYTTTKQCRKCHKLLGKSDVEYGVCVLTIWSYLEE